MGISCSFSTLRDWIDGLDKGLSGSLIIIHGEFLTQSAPLTIFVIQGLSLRHLGSLSIGLAEPNAASEVQLLGLAFASDVGLQ